MEENDDKSDLEEVLSNYDDDVSEVKANSGPVSPLSIIDGRAESRSPVNSFFDFTNKNNPPSVLSSPDPGSLRRDNVNGGNHEPQSVRLISSPLSVRDDTLDSPPSSKAVSPTKVPIPRRLSIPQLNLTTVISPLSPLSDASVEKDDAAEKQYVNTIPKVTSMPVVIPVLTQLKPKRLVKKEDRKGVISLKTPEKKKIKDTVAAGKTAPTKSSAAPLREKAQNKTITQPFRTVSKEKRVSESPRKTVKRNPKKFLERQDSFPEQVLVKNPTQPVRTATKERQNPEKIIKKAKTTQLMKQQPQKQKLQPPTLQRPDRAKQLQSQDEAAQKENKTIPGLRKPVRNQSKTLVAKIEETPLKEQPLKIGKSTKNPSGNQPKSVNAVRTTIVTKKSLNSTFTIGRVDESQSKPVNIRLRHLSVKLPKFPLKQTTSKRHKRARTASAVKERKAVDEMSKSSKIYLSTGVVNGSQKDENADDAVHLDKTLQRLVDFTVNDSNHSPQESYLAYFGNRNGKQFRSSHFMPRDNLTQIKSGLFLESSQQELKLYDKLLAETSHDVSRIPNYVERLRYDEKVRHKSSKTSSAAIPEQMLLTENKKIEKKIGGIPVIQDGENTFDNTKTFLEQAAIRATSLPPYHQHGQYRSAEGSNIKEAEIQLRSRVMRDIMKLNDFSPQTMKEIMVSHFDRLTWPEAKTTTALEASQIASILSSILIIWF
ncbi:uncharacterized protein LOC129581935 [Paramacrobiotus metropolitanus]|uniref:uncharacterized protein LOC129581935 n=1 Tax=Paramacrobiotus metropolitanus TaxID=2943436 RepID=UPI002445C642|nr:uncharacterized protein LOC129581935 [Paramacrobiotus metropolitanus]